MYIDKENDMVKLCEKCNIVKDLENGFYRAGTSYQTYCKPCHNKKRLDYKITNKPYIPKKKGFDKLEDEVKSNILYDISVKINYRKIAKKYDIKYSTLCNWKRRGLAEKLEVRSSGILLNKIE